MGQRTGIEVRHKKACASRNDGRCNCQPTYQASVWSARESKRIRKTFPTLAEARAWRSETQTGVRRGTLRAPAQTTVQEAADALVAGMKSGHVRTRSGDVYKPSAIRSYEAALRDHILPRLGRTRLGDVQHRDVQRIADDLLAERAYDEKAHIEIEPKSRAGRRTVPIVGALRDILVAHKANQDRADGLV